MANRKCLWCRKPLGWRENVNALYCHGGNCAQKFRKWIKTPEATLAVGQWVKGKKA
jgi:hypothetical protein